MFRKIAMAILCAQTFEACATVPLAGCQLLDKQGTVVRDNLPLYPVRHSRRFMVTQDVFLDLKYDYRSASIAVEAMKVPHFPWTFAEKSLERATLTLSGPSPKSGMLPLAPAAPGYLLLCREIAQDSPANL